MAISLASLQRGQVHKPPRLMVYGVPKIGKTTLATSAPKPVVIQTEDGADNIGADRFPLAKTYQEVMDALTVLASEQHDYKTLVMDSLDWFEPLVWAHTIKMNPAGEKGHAVSSIEDYGYGKGFGLAMTYWHDYIDAINYLRDSVGMAIIQIAHSRVVRFDSPDQDSFDRYDIKLHKTANALLQEHSDAVLFVNYQTHVTKQDAGFGKKIAKGVGTGQRLIHTEKLPAFEAGNRYSMPSPLQFPRENSFDAIAQHIPFYATQGGEVVNG